MPRTRFSHTPNYRHHKASGQAVVTLNGKDYYLGPYGTAESRGEYDRLISLWLANGRHLPTLQDEPTDLRIVEILAAYWRHAETYYRKNGRPTSSLTRIKQVMDTLERLCGRTPAAGYSAKDLKAFREHLVRLGLARNTINQYVNVARAIFAWAVENELVPPSVYHGLQAVRGLRKGRSQARETLPIKPVPEKHVEKIKSFVSPEVWAMIQLQRLTGMRPGEARMMRGCDLEMSGRIWEYRPEGHKTEHHGHERMIAIGPRAQRIVKPFLKPGLSEYLFSPRCAERTRNAERRRNRKSPMTPARGRESPKDAGSVITTPRMLTPLLSGGPARERESPTGIPIS